MPCSLCRVARRIFLASRMLFRSADHRGLAFAVWGILQVALAKWTCNAPVQCETEKYCAIRLLFLCSEVILTVNIFLVFFWFLLCFILLSDFQLSGSYLRDGLNTSPCSCCIPYSLPFQLPPSYTFWLIRITMYKHSYYRSTYAMEEYLPPEIPSFWSRRSGSPGDCGQ